MFDIQEELKKLPDHPGVYIMHDCRDEIIYIGKAVSLKKRVRQYFQAGGSRSPKIGRMISLIERFEYILTDSEMEALVLECNLIKEHRPRYNTLLKDDKAYPYIKVTLGEEYPRVLFSRKMRKDTSKYFGPYTSAGGVKDTIDLLQRMYHLRTCSRSLPRDIGKDRPCLNYHIGRCSGPCAGFISREEYARGVKGALDFLEGNCTPILKELEYKMNEASEALKFEEAAKYRDLLSSAKQITESQNVSGSDGEDKDYIALAMDETDAVAAVFFVRGGKLIGREHFHIAIGNEDAESEIMSAFTRQYYAGTPFIPKEIMLQTDIPDKDMVERWLSEKRERRVYLHVPKRGRHEKLMELAKENARIVLSQDKEKIKREEGRTIGAAKEIADLLGLKDVRRMEAYDISNISGFESVGSMVVYEKGRPKKSDYRKFKLKTVEGPDDYASMREVLTRRFTHAVREQEEHTGHDGFTSMPDLILMDGGKGQVNIALAVLDELGLDIPVCGMVKDDHHRTRGIYFKDRELPIDIHSEGFKLVTRIQDEAHRFAIEYHRSLRSSAQTHSVLDDIPLIGEKRRNALLRAYPSLDAIRRASIKELAALPSMDQASARSVYEFFHKE